MTSEGTRHVQPSRSGLVAAVLALLVVALAACGGGVGTGGTGSFAVGPITGFGSIVVNGVHYDESAARIEADDGSQRARTDLRLGMVVEVDAGEQRDARAQADRVRIVSALVGRVGAVDVARAELRVNGVPVRINASTVFDEAFAGGLAAVPLDGTVEVYGFADGDSGAILATRVEPRGGASGYKFRGTVRALDTTQRTFRIGVESFSYASLSSPSPGLAEGVIVRVEVAPQPDAAGRWVVQTLGIAATARDDRDAAEVSGLITAYRSGVDFDLDGIRVDASGASIAGGPLAAGLRVEVEGPLRGGVLVARTVKVEDEQGSGVFEFEGVLTQLDPDTKTFRLTSAGGPGQLVSYARPDVQFVRGDVTNLRAGRRVEVKGVLSADGTRIEATRIEFED